MAWRTLWSTDSLNRDQSFKLPIALAADARHLYVLDPAAARVTALRLEDGTVAWIADAQRTPGVSFTRPSAMTLDASGRVVVADMASPRLTYLSPDGKATAEVPLQGLSYVTALCGLRGGDLLAYSFGDPTPLVRVTPAGEVRSRSALPWPDLASVASLQAQVTMGRRQSDGSCTVALSTGRGFAQFTDSGGFGPPRRYVEYFELPDMVVTRPAGGTPEQRRAGSEQKLVGLTPAAASVAEYRGALTILFGGRESLANRVVDVYSQPDGKYAYSFVLPRAADAIATSGETLFILSRRHGVSVISALKSTRP